MFFFFFQVRFGLSFTTLRYKTCLCELTPQACYRLAPSFDFSTGFSRPRALYSTRTYVRVRKQTMVSGVVSLEVDHKKGLVVVRGRPEAVEEGRKEFQNKLASLFPGDFLAVRFFFFFVLQS